MCGGSRAAVREEQFAVYNMHPFADRSNVGGLSQYYFTQECGFGIANMGEGGLMAVTQTAPDHGFGAMAAGKSAYEQLTGKRGCDDESICAKRARIATTNASAIAGVDAGAPHSGVPHGYWYMADSCQDSSPQACPTPDVQMRSVSVYEQYLMREQELMSAQQTNSSTFRCPSEWSGTEWDTYGVAPVSAQNSMDCDIHAKNPDTSLYISSVYGDLPPRGC